MSHVWIFYILVGGAAVSRIKHGKQGCEDQLIVLVSSHLRVSPLASFLLFDPWTAGPLTGNILKAWLGRTCSTWDFIATVNVGIVFWNVALCRATFRFCPEDGGGPSKTMPSICQTTSCPIPEDSSLHKLQIFGKVCSGKYSSLAD
jgi:hypothetical protein